MSDDEIELEEESLIDQYSRVLARLNGRGIRAINGVFVIAKDRILSKEQVEDIEWLMDEYDYGFERKGE
jgi:hypothetical protein